MSYLKATKTIYQKHIQWRSYEHKDYFFRIDNGNFIFLRE